jgi:hypothetical protein
MTACENISFNFKTVISAINPSKQKIHMNVKVGKIRRINTSILSNKINIVQNMQPFPNPQV